MYIYIYIYICTYISSRRARDARARRNIRNIKYYISHLSQILRNQHQGTSEPATHVPEDAQLVEDHGAGGRSAGRGESVRGDDRNSSYLSLGGTRTLVFKS